MGFKKLEKEVRIIDQALKHSIYWLEKSGIQNSLNKKSLLSGSVNAWYDPQKKKIFFRILPRDLQKHQKNNILQR